MENLKNSNFIIKKPIKHHINQVIEVSITSDISCLYRVIRGIMEWDGHFISAVFYPKTYYNNLVKRKTSEKIKIKRHSTEISQDSSKLAITWEKERLRNCHRSQETKETWWLDKCGILDAVLGQRCNFTGKVMNVAV